MGEVRRRPLAVAADAGVAGTDFPDVPAASDQGLNVPLPSRQFLHLLEVGRDAREALEVSGDELARLRPRDKILGTIFSFAIFSRRIRKKLELHG